MICRSIKRQFGSLLYVDCTRDRFSQVLFDANVVLM